MVDGAASRTPTNADEKSENTLEYWEIQTSNSTTASPRSSYGSPSSHLGGEISQAYTEKELLDQACIRYISWEVFDQQNEFSSRKYLDIHLPRVLIRFHHKKKIVFIAAAQEAHGEIIDKDRLWLYLKEKRKTLSKQFDGFFIYYCCVYDTSDYSRLTYEQKASVALYIDSYHLFIQHCYVLVANPFSIFSQRFWMMWECFNAIKSRKLVVNEHVVPLLKSTGTNPSFELVEKMLKQTATFSRTQHSSYIESLRSLYFKGAKYTLIPIEHLLQCDEWESVVPVPLALDHVDPSKVIMISHRWETVQHPDPLNTKLRTIQQFLLEEVDGRPRHLLYQYVFFDFRCIDQMKDTIESLLKINELYSNSPCLCLCDGDYFERSWCLFELCINKFNAGSPTILGSQSQHPVLSWLEQARLVQQMGYVHALKECHHCVEGCQTTTTLELPLDQLHLKTQFAIPFFHLQHHKSRRYAHHFESA